MADNPADRPALHAALQAALLRRDKLASEVVFYLLLRNYIEAGLFDAAHLLVQSTTLADPPASPNIAARRSFYIARLRATQLLFDMAAESLRLALHRSPDRAVGFRAAVLAYSVVVSLLRGEVPARSTFTQQSVTVRTALAPYLLLSGAVRAGRVDRFDRIVAAHAPQFTRDGCLALVSRVRQVVVKAGLLTLCQAYVRIPLADVCARMAFDSPADAEWAVAKAVRDGVVDATIDCDAQCVVAGTAADIYSSAEPAAALRKRIDALNAVHDDAVRSMRFAPGAAEEEPAEREEDEGDADDDASDLMDLFQ